MKLVAFAASAAVIALPVSAASAEEAIVIAPSSAWNLDYSEEACRLGRQFGEGDDKVTLILAKYAPGTAMEILVSGKRLSSERSRSFHYSFDPNERIEVERPLFGELDNGETMWQFSGGILEEDQINRLEKAEATSANYKKVEAENAGRVSSFTVKVGRKPPVTITTGKLTAPLSAMDQCLDSLVASWGYDPSEQAELASGPEPIGRITSWFNYRDYPKDALRSELAGAVRFRLAVNPEGAITDCVIQSSYSDPAFPEKVCAEFKRNGRFKPALNANGEGVASYWANSVLFVPS